MRLPRTLLAGLASKQLGLLCLMLVGLPFLAFQYLQGEISRLDTARLKLEETLSKIDSTDRRHILSSANGEMDIPPSVNQDDMIVLYNRVPKTGSTSFAGIAYELCTRNRYHVLHLNISRNNHILSLADQMRLITNMTNWYSKKPALYHGHVAFIDFTKFGITHNPIYINLVRDPLDRLVSYYYFIRNGDDFRPNVKRRRADNKESFDDCVARSGRDCDPDELWMQIPFFCGHSSECLTPGNKWALQQAKYNLVHHYLIVGITEELGDFIAVLETVLPRFFAGASELYEAGRKSHLRKTFNKISPSAETLAKFQQSEVWQMEQEFYEFARDQFNFIRKKAFTLKNGVLEERQQKFMYEKIRPR